ncbi:hypothetical protein [Marispirochaeta sp.]|uniref:hypothetical protein n=1 Tax=Marispirochaeta sp. TaxID=2038653 RepID=UPI0029C9995C|nr:hypothetical protein [Marispirochaeta sp.]
MKKKISLLLLVLLLVFSSCKNENVMGSAKSDADISNSQDTKIDIEEIEFIHGKVFDGNLRLRNYPFLDAEKVGVLTDGENGVWIDYILYLNGNNHYESKLVIDYQIGLSNRLVEYNLYRTI